MCEQAASLRLINHIVLIRSRSNRGDDSIFVVHPYDWTVLGRSLVNTFCQVLSASPLAFEFRWGEVAQRRMDAFVRVDIIEKAAYLADSISIALVVR